jgi:hypothetical protein
MTHDDAGRLLPAGCVYVGHTGRRGCKTHDPDSSLFRAPSGALYEIKWLPNRYEWAEPRELPSDVERYLSLREKR